ncbi:DUF1385 domain-containing protein [Conexibacter sp. W3-3-2]|uniref:DUF1385 domain-containing protein n=1 Tax=Paraconexibacter algicola TaxID=2133960 RepID=A0A2T4UJC3_9ACTN|nr:MULTISPECIES: DUF1385 domain-containing protein [Solirubrobacterales]MTD45674.1 DUF1385 domain-containing protein [Conexibacter sp. W3-3-2]PTL59341.1 hypothetical protein C7Y72_06585 [Paraconexibacter algicola]
MSATPEKLRLGGMALGNGLLVHGPTAWSAAIRRADGTIGVASGRKPRLRGRVEDVPGARGVVKLGEAMLVIPLVKRALPDAKLPFQSASTVAAMGATALAGQLVRKRLPGTGGEAAVAVLSLAPSLLALRSGDLAAYHGVEHKAIAAYEQGDGADAAEAAKEHDRCGSHLMAPLLTANVAGGALLRRLVERPTPAHGAALSLASLGVAVEVFVWSEKHADSAVTRALRRPGHELQRVLGTREPTAEQLEVGAAALQEILRAEGAETTA